MSNVVECIQVQGLVAKIYQDSDPQNPEDMTDSPVWLGHYHRQFWRDPKELPFRDGPGFVDWFKGYNGEEREGDDLSGPGAPLFLARRKQELQEQWAVFVVRAYIHGGVSLALEGSIDHLRMPDQQFDVSRCGVVLIDKKKWHGGLPAGAEVPEDDDRYWREIAEAHVKEWNQYLGGEVYGYRVVEGENDDNEVDSCWGYYGIEAVREAAREAAEACFEKIKREGEEFDAFCDSLDQETLDALVHDAKSEEASAINNDGKGAQVNYLLESGFTRATLRAQAAARRAADEVDRPTDEVNLFVGRVVHATDEGIRQFGEYHFSDKGPGEVMDVDQFADELRKMLPASAGERLEAVARKGKTYKKVADAILGQLDNTAEDWWEKCCENCPSVEAEQDEVVLAEPEWEVCDTQPGTSPGAGWEPFAVSCGGPGAHYVWWRRRRA